MRELDLLSRIYDRSRDLSATYPHILTGPGDDCAVIAAPSGPLLLKVDQLIEGRHFVRGTSLDLIARKAIARAVSDIAAMAGTPTAALAAATLPRHFPQEPANALFDAASRWARHFGCPLVGGDISSFANTDAPIALTITIIGVPHPTRGPVLRTGAQPGDAIYITGAVGSSFDKTTGGGRHLTFEPRLREAAWLAGTLGHDLHAMLDTSDGLGLDTARLAAAGGVSIELQGAAIPLNPNHRAKQLLLGAPIPHAHLQEAIADGEDYELLFAAPASRKVPNASPTGTPITRIGTALAPGRACTMCLPDGTTIDIARQGWEHH